ncbi:MAG: cupredoxin domain-containing protein [Candidatus Berkelbacteria bacterium]|nr:cupredoxin domain-containing protein [Candidatus Berkelbacteria bacterium]
MQVHNIVTNNNGTQVIKMRQDAKGYTPNNFTVKVGQPVEWVIESTNSNVCSASLYSEKLKINQYLKIGQNTINFTPGEAGIIPFSCSMGMYRGSIEVVN